MTLEEYIQFFDRDPDLAYDWTVSEDCGRLLMEAIGFIRTLRAQVKELSR